MKKSPYILFSWVPAFLFSQSAIATSPDPLAATGSAPAARVSENVLGKYVIDPATISQSLLFDQDFDKQKIRPAPILALAKKSEKALQKAPPRQRSTEILAKYFDEGKLDYSSIWSQPPQYPRTLAKGDLMLGPVDKIVVPVDHRVDEIFHKEASSVKVAAAVVSKEITESPKPVAVSVNLPENLYRPGGLELLLVDEESFLEKKPKVVTSATVHWAHANSGISSASNSSGRVLPPNNLFASARFVVIAEGYLPAIGYAIRNMITPVILVKEKRLGPVLKSLAVSPVPGRSIVWGKLVSAAMEARGDITIESSSPDIKAHYSLGSYGLFHKGAKVAGPQGDFLLSNLPHELHYLLPAENISGEISDLPPALLNLAGLGPVATTTMVDAKPTSIRTQVADGLSLEKPATAVYATIGGQRGMFTADDEGFVDLKNLPLRNQIDLLEIRASGYLKNWVNAPAENGSFPDLISLFNRAQLNELLDGSGVMLQQANPVILGQLRPEIFASRYTVELLDVFGSPPDGANVVYFDSNNRPNSRAEATDVAMQTFAVVNLPAGEYHLLLRDAESQRLVSMQLVRCADGVISQVQF